MTGGMGAAYELPGALRSGSNETALTHYVYRLVDAEDRVFYVACTSNVAARMRQHRDKFRRYGLRLAELDGPYSRDEGLIQEADVISNLRPELNRHHNPDHHAASLIPDGLLPLVPAAVWANPRSLIAWCDGLGEWLAVRYGVDMWDLTPADLTRDAIAQQDAAWFARMRAAVDGISLPGRAAA